MSRQKIQRWKKPLGGVAALTLFAGGVAFALLRSQATLSGNSIETDSANLVISQNDTTYSNSAAGYRFAHIIPGAQPSQTEHFFLRNAGTAALALKVDAPAAPGNPANVDLSKVRIILAPYDMTTHLPGAPQSFSLQSLIDSAADGGSAIDYPALGPNAIEEFDIQAAMDQDAVNGSAATSLSNLNLTFSGAATANTD
jgi:hypothetical protein